MTLADPTLARPAAVRTAEGVAALGTVLGVWAHPDDEAYLSGGLMALARAAGSRVVCVTATRGEHGTPDPAAWPPERLAAERTEELRRSLAVLGVAEHHWLGYADGGCTRADAAGAVDRLSAIVAEVRPDTVLTFGPDGVTGHPDHRTVSAWTTAAFAQAAPAGARLLHAAVPAPWAARWRAFNERFSVYEPGFPVTVPAERLAVALEVTGEARDRKLGALRAQATQTAGLIAAVGVAEFAAWAADEAFVEHRPSSRVLRT